MRKKISVLIFAICFCLMLPLQALAQTAEATSTAGASAGATAIGSGGIAGAQAQTGDSSATLLLQQNSTGSKIPVNLPNPGPIPAGPVISNFGPVGEAWNISPKAIGLITSIKSVWTADEARALSNREVDSSSQDVFCFPSCKEVQILFELSPEQKEQMRLVGTISVRGDENANTFDAFSRAIRDTAKMGGMVLLITRNGGQCQVESSGWGIGVGGLQSTTSGGDGRLGAAGYFGTGYGSAKSLYVGKPFVEGLALRPKNAMPKIEVLPSREGIWFDDEGRPLFPWEKAKGAGIINGN